MYGLPVGTQEGVNILKPVFTPNVPNMAAWSVGESAKRYRYPSSMICGVVVRWASVKSEKKSVPGGGRVSPENQ